MKDTFVETSNVRRFYDTLGSLQARGAHEACMMVLDGEPGLGKTTTMARFYAQTSCLFVRAETGWDYGWFLNAMLKELNIEPPHARMARFEALISAIEARSTDAIVAGRTYAMVIDECDLVSSRRDIMEAIRDLTDATFVPTILVGMGRLRDHLRRYPQIESRAPRKVRFLPATLEDTAAIIAGRCEVPVAPDLVQFVWKVSRGYNREILEAIAHIERFGRRMDPGPEGLTCADMDGQVIISDRTTGQPVVVRA